MEAIDNEALVKAFMKSDKTLEEALAFFGADEKEPAPAKVPAKCRRKKRA